MKRSIKSIFVLIIMSGLFIQNINGDEAIYIRFFTGYDFQAGSVWEDVDCEDTSNVPLYGCGYYAKGKAGNSTAFDLFAGYRINRSLSVEIGMLYRPALSFKGQVNYPDAGEDQPVRASMDIKALTFNMVFNFLQIFSFTRPDARFLPYISCGIGISRNSLNEFFMYFPELAKPHYLYTPKGRDYVLCFSAAIGNSYKLSETIYFDMQAAYVYFGKMGTEAGDAVIIRGDDIFNVPINETEATLKTYGIKAGLRYIF